MKNKIIASIILLGLVFANHINASARTEHDEHELDFMPSNAFIEIGENEATVTFEELGFRETTLVSPYDSTRVFFSVPPNWQLIPGGTIQLDYEISLTGADAQSIGTEQNPYGGSLFIS